jgi:hypothetical protein
LEGHGGAVSIGVGSDVFGRVGPLEFARLFEASLDKPGGSGVDVPKVGVRDEGTEDEFYLRAFVGVRFELSVVEERIEDAEVGVAKLTVS